MSLVVSKKNYSKYISIILISALFTGLITFAPQPALAILGAGDTVIEVGPSGASNYKTSVESTFSAIANKSTAYTSASVEVKETVLDKIAWTLINLILEQMIKSTTQWVNSGFEGNPAFVSNLSDYMTDLADKVAGNFIWGENGDGPLAFLCSPFALDVKLALSYQYGESRQGSYEAECKLSDALNNAEGLANGNFLQGGLDGWFDVALNDDNNAYGAMYQAQAALAININDEKANELDLLGWADGFLTMKDENGKTITPGAVIQNQLAETLSIPTKRLTIADELNELVGSLMQQLLSQVMSSSGLLGATNASPGSSSGSYFDRIESEVQNAEGSINIESSTFENAVSLETRYLGLQEQIISLINAAEAQCSTLTPSLRTQLTDATRNASTSRALVAKLTVFRDDLKLLNEATNVNAPEVRSLLTKYNASSIPVAQSKLMQQYLTYRASGALHSEADIAFIEAAKLAETVPNRDYWIIQRDNLRAEILFFTTDDPETRRIYEACLVPSTTTTSPSSFTAPI